MTLDITAPATPVATTQTYTVIKTLGNQEEFNRDKLLHAIKKATGYTEDRVRIAEEVADYVMKKLSAPTISTGYINALVEGYLLAKFEKTKEQRNTGRYWTSMCRTRGGSRMSWRRRCPI